MALGKYLQAKLILLRIVRESPTGLSVSEVAMESQATYSRYHIPVPPAGAAEVKSQLNAVSTVRRIRAGSGR